MVPRALLELSDLTVEFSRGRRRPPLRAVDKVSFEIGQRQTVALVGESGSGKTTIGRAVLGLVPTTSGRIFFEGNEITNASHRVRQALSGELQVIFQDPYSSLNPTRTIGQTLSETLMVQARGESRATIASKVAEMLEQVGLPRDATRRYPAHFSGGQRQRIAIARALIVRPRLVICDEPTSALDLSVQAQVLNLLRELQDAHSLSYLFISHDLAVVRHLSHRVIVLYQGRIMEAGDAATVSERPLHPYTQALLEAAPVPDPRVQRWRRANRRRLRSTPKLNEFGAGCPFVWRCPHAIDACRTDTPALEETPAGGHIACHRWRELDGEARVSPMASQVI